MTTGDFNQADLDNMLSWLEDGQKFFAERAEQYRQGEAAVRLTQKLWHQYQLESAPIMVDEDGPTHFGVSASDIVQCPTIREAVELIACKSNGHLHYRTAAKVVLQAGLSKSKKLDNLSADICRQLRHSQDWEQASPGVYRYLPYTQRDPDGTRPERAANLVPVSTAHLPLSPRFGGGAGW